MYDGRCDLDPYIQSLLVSNAWCQMRPPRRSETSTEKIWIQGGPSDDSATQVSRIEKEVSSPHALEESSTAQQKASAVFHQQNSLMQKETQKSAFSPTIQKPSKISEESRHSAAPADMLNHEEADPLTTIVQITLSDYRLLMACAMLGTSLVGPDERSRVQKLQRLAKLNLHSANDTSKVLMDTVVKPASVHPAAQTVETMLARPIPSRAQEYATTAEAAEQADVRPARANREATVAAVVSPKPNTVEGTEEHKERGAAGKRKLVEKTAVKKSSKQVSSVVSVKQENYSAEIVEEERKQPEEVEESVKVNETAQTLPMAQEKTRGVQVNGMAEGSINEAQEAQLVRPLAVPAAISLATANGLAPESAQAAMISDQCLFHGVTMQMDHLEDTHLQTQAASGINIGNAGSGNGEATSNSEEGALKWHSVDPREKKTRRRKSEMIKEQKRKRVEGTIKNRERVTLWHRSKRCKLSGNAAPLRANLDDYLMKNTEYEVYANQDNAVNMKPRSRMSSFHMDWGLWSSDDLSRSDKAKSDSQVPRNDVSLLWHHFSDNS